MSLQKKLYIWNGKKKNGGSINVLENVENYAKHELELKSCFIGWKFGFEYFFQFIKL